jgi:hypothetical protein
MAKNPWFICGLLAPAPPRPKPIAYGERLYLPPKKGFDPDGLTASRRSMFVSDEDYTESVCLLLPFGDVTLVDVRYFDRLASVEWQVLGRTVFVGTGKKRTYRGRTQNMVSLQRRVLLLEIDDLATSVMRWNAGQELARNLANREIDHESRNFWDNRRGNLRFATTSENAHNRPGKPNASSKYKGVSKMKGREKWVANVTLNGKQHYLGTFDDEVAAAIAYNRFIKDNCPKFGFLNPITALPTDEPLKPRRSRRCRSAKSA